MRLAILEGQAQHLTISMRLAILEGQAQHLAISMRLAILEGQVAKKKNWKIRIATQVYKF
jgi:hypothetical protein